MREWVRSQLCVKFIYKINLVRNCAGLYKQDSCMYKINQLERVNRPLSILQKHQTQLERNDEFKSTDYSFVELNIHQMPLVGPNVNMIK